ncbi:MAG TPA: malate synthase A, partial [Paracoccus sp.]|nr:malate synthase A [Paracoccus sp. (in: a-proteobacteria)]
NLARSPVLLIVSFLVVGGCGVDGAPGGPAVDITVDGEVIPASLFDWGLYMWHNAKELSFSQRRPYFYLPKLEHWHEASWWDEVLSWGEKRLGLDHGSCRATVLIETFPAAFQMNEILWALRDHSVGLNCGRWDYIFSYIKCFSADPLRITPDRDLITMEETFMSTYSSLLIDTCHQRGCHAMGGMAAQIPVRDQEENRIAMNRVRDDKIREVVTGHDGTWVAHPGLVGLAMEVFDDHMPTPNQVDYRNKWCTVGDDRLTELLTQAPEVSISSRGLRHNVDVGVRYLAAWLNGQGCVSLYNLMEDAATAEISRTQVWQWLHHGAEDNLDQLISVDRLE